MAAGTVGGVRASVNVDLSHTRFDSVTFSGAHITDCDLTGMTIDGVLVEDALRIFRDVKTASPPTNV
jgi:uncharacterized protein YjbI with pentapeptide repeats